MGSKSQKKHFTATLKERRKALERLLSPEHQISFPSWRQIKRELGKSREAFYHKLRGSLKGKGVLKSLAEERKKDRSK